MTELDSKDAEIVQKTMNGILTTNKHGYMLQIDDPNFVESLSLIDKYKPVADFGVAYGFSTKRLLEEGFNVVANDLDEKMLNHLLNNISEEQKQRLKLVPGNLLNLEFEENSFGAIYALRWMHFLKGAEFRLIFENFYKWLAPGGVLVVACGFTFEIDETKFKYKRLNNHEWPGEMEFVSDNSFLNRIIPGFINIISLEVLLREALRAGFEIFRGIF